MPVPTTNVGLSDIAAEFGGTVPHALSEYYGDGSAPASGTIRFSHLAGESAGPTFVGSQLMTPSVVNSYSGYTHWTSSNGPHPGGVSGIQNGDLCVLLVKLGQIRRNGYNDALQTVPSSNGSYTDLSYLTDSTTNSQYNRILGYWIYDSSKSSQRVTHGFDTTYTGWGVSGVLMVFRGATTHYGYGVTTKVWDGTYASRTPDPPSVTASQQCSLWLSLMGKWDGGYNNTGDTIPSSDVSSGYTFINQDRMNQSMNSSGAAGGYRIVNATTENPGGWGNYYDYRNFGITIGFA